MNFEKHKGRLNRHKGRHNISFKKITRILAVLIITLIVNAFLINACSKSLANKPFENTFSATDIKSPENQSDQPNQSDNLTQIETINTNVDLTGFTGIDSTKKEWGVVLNKNGNAPYVTDKIKDTIAKYNAYYTGDLSRQQLYLIFSASYDNGNMIKILDVLSDKEVKVVFYLVGDFVRAYPELVRRMIDEGHAIGNHSSTHKCLPVVNDTILYNDVVEYHKYIKGSFNYEMKHFMPPSGEYSEKVLALANAMGYTTQFWSITYDDYDPSKVRGEDYAFNKVTSHLHNGAFIFLHSVSYDNTAALGRIIDYCKERNFEFGIFNRE